MSSEDMPDCFGEFGHIDPVGCGVCEWAGDCELAQADAEAQVRDLID